MPPDQQRGDIVNILDEPLLREEEAAQQLKVRPQTMSAWRYHDQGPAYVRVGKLIFYRPSDIRAYIASRVVRPQGSASR
jgi:Helix-turn-helix domain